MKRVDVFTNSSTRSKWEVSMKAFTMFDVELTGKHVDCRLPHIVLYTRESHQDSSESCEINRQCSLIEQTYIGLQAKCSWSCNCGEINCDSFYMLISKLSWLIKEATHSPKLCGINILSDEIVNKLLENTEP